MNKAIGILTITPLLFLTSCGSDGGTPTTTPPVAGAPQYAYTVMFNAGEMTCMLENTDVKSVTVLRTDPNTGHMTEVKLRPCEPGTL